VFILGLILSIAGALAVLGVCYDAGLKLPTKRKPLLALAGSGFVGYVGLVLIAFDTENVLWLFGGPIVVVFVLLVPSHQGSGRPS